MSSAKTGRRPVPATGLGRTEISYPETNGFCERFHRTVKEEFFAVAFRRTLYESLDQLQGDPALLA